MAKRQFIRCIAEGGHRCLISTEIIEVVIERSVGYEFKTKLGNYLADTEKDEFFKGATLDDIMDEFSLDCR